MIAANRYLEMARECLECAAEADDPRQRKSLVDMAKLYTQTALDMQGAMLPSSEHINAEPKAG